MDLRLFQSARPPFLILGPLTAGLAVAASLSQGVQVHWGIAGLILLAVVAGHVSANAFNEVFDFQSGLDTNTQRTPFSGGSGLLPRHPELLGAVKALAWGSLLITILLGLWLAWMQTPTLIGLGLLGVVLIYGYTRWLHRWPLTCYLAPGLGFGGVIYLGTSWALGGNPSLLDACLAGIVGVLSCNLLLLNQFPDRQADRAVGRRHFPITHGTRASALIYAYGVLIVAGLMICMITLAELSPWIGLAFLPLLATPGIVYLAYRHGEDHQRLLPAMGLNVGVTLSVPLLLAIVMFLAPQAI